MHVMLLRHAVSSLYMCTDHSGREQAAWTRHAVSSRYMHTDQSGREQAAWTRAAVGRLNVLVVSCGELHFMVCNASEAWSESKSCCIEAAFIMHTTQNDGRWLQTCLSMAFMTFLICAPCESGCRPRPYPTVLQDILVCSVHVVRMQFCAKHAAS